jgi:hypothetical protein
MKMVIKALLTKKKPQNNYIRFRQKGKKMHEINKSWGIITDTAKMKRIGRDVYKI